MFGSRISRSIVKVALGGAATLTLALCITAAPASAYTLYGSGYPGTVGAPFTFGYSTGYGTGAILVPDRVVTESTAYGRYDQYVCVTMNRVASSGAKFWTTAETIRNCAWIPAASTSVTVKGAWFNNLVGMNLAIYAVNVVVTWQLSNGYQVGTRTLDYNQVGDYNCQTAYCGIGMTTWGGGAYLTFSR
jgi:hypothetical protein